MNVAYCVLLAMVAFTVGDVVAVARFCFFFFAFAHLRKVVKLNKFSSL